jgi:hypothetical protein
MSIFTGQISCPRRQLARLRRQRLVARLHGYALVALARHRRAGGRNHRGRDVVRAAGLAPNTVERI